MNRTVRLFLKQKICACRCCLVAVALFFVPVANAAPNTNSFYGLTNLWDFHLAFEPARWASLNVAVSLAPGHPRPSHLLVSRGAAALGARVSTAPQDEVHARTTCRSWRR